MINPLGNQQQQAINRAGRAVPTATAEKTDKAPITKEEQAQQNYDEFVKKNETADAGIYQKPDKKLSLDQLRAANEQRITAFQDMLSKMVGTQVKTFNKAMFANLNVTAAQSAEAQKAIAPGGEWSPDAVAGRILDMAKALSGGDASKFELLKNAVKKGFGEAEKAWGDKLPDITNQTYDKVMKGFDDWEKELKGTGATDTE